MFLLCRLSPFRRFGLLLLIAAAFLLSGCARTDPDAQVFRLDDHLAAAEVSAPSVRSFVDEAVPLRWDFEEQAVTWRPVSGRGTVYSFVIARHAVHPAIRELEQLPYNVCVIELEEQAGLRIVSNVLDVAPEDIRIGLPVEVRFMPAPNDPAVVLAMFAPVQTP